MDPTRLFHWARCVLRLAVGLDGPYVLLAAVTHRCNLRCRYCGVWKESGPEMDTGQWKSLLDEARRSGTLSVSFCGGEPLVREDLGALVAHASKRGLRTSLTTNGWYVRERGPELEALDAITISVDGPGEIHDHLRGEGSFERAMDAVRWGVENHKPVYTVTVVSRHNLRTLEDTCRQINGVGALPFIQPATPYIFSGDSPDEWVLDARELRQLAEDLARLRDAGVRLGNSDGYLRGLGKAPDFRRERACSAGRRFVTVLPDGRLVPCHITVREDAPRYEEGGFAEAFQKTGDTCDEGCAIAPYFEYDATLGRPSPAGLQRAWKVLASRAVRTRDTE